MTTLRRWPFILLALVSNACAVDDRTLELADDAGARGGGSGNATGGSGSGSSGEGGESNSGGLVDGCADLDTDGVADCEETLVENPTFNADVNGWVGVGDAILEWDSMNALDDAPSGSAKLGDDTPAGALRARAEQCVPLEGEWFVIAYASAFVETIDESEDSAQAVLEVSFFQGEACDGPSDLFFETPPSSITDEWTTIHAGGLSPDTTRSVLVALVGTKAAADSELSVYFDNVMLKVKEP